MALIILWIKIINVILIVDMKGFKGKDGLKNYLNSISPISDKTFDDVEKHFRKETLSKDDFFVKERDYASKIAFLEQR